ncbi:MAG: hypothetical protein OEZ01_15835 [Candidatus Heimdallarchaeota archaeon]|nr:hypothetical protein [Candidatus Heimdallarchaeota archaeon]MDH5647481.1 hypothetical protein [Candidatus Heimdallarchaeota archaeon]
MIVWDDIREILIKDTKIAFDTWKSMIYELFPDDIEYCYGKGSAIKPIESLIDYVPQISDIDIHIKEVDGRNMFSNYDEAINVSKIFESRYIEAHPDYYHIPRTQIMFLHRLETKVKFVYPKLSDIKQIYGNIKFPSNTISNEEVKKIDHNNILEQKAIVDNAPYRLIDRYGIDYWSFLRGLVFRVSPTPVRLLTQFVDEPLEIWKLNRTKIHKLLLSNNFTDIASSYFNYYKFGWNLFESDMKTSKSYIPVISSGLKVLELTYNEAIKITNG